VKKNKLHNIIQTLVHEYTGTGASGGNATDGNDIRSPRPFKDDKTEVEKAYTQKNVYGAEGGHYKRYSTKSDFERDRRGGMFEEEEVEEQPYSHATLTTQGQSIYRAPGVWEEDEEELEEQITPDEMQFYNNKKISHQKSIAKIDIEIARKNKDAISNQLQQQTQATTPQLDQIEQQMFELVQNLRDKKRQNLTLKQEYKEKYEYFNELPPEEEEERLKVYEELVNARNSVTAMEEEILGLQNQQGTLAQQRDNILKSKSQAQAQASTAMKQADRAIKDQEKAMRNIGKQMQENILSQYLKDRKNTNLMEQMDMYKEQTEGSLKKFFEMFQDGKTNEEVMQHFAKRGINIPEQYMTKAKKYFESYKKLQLELGFMDQEAKDFKKASVLEDEPVEEKKLTSSLFKENLLKKQITKELLKNKK
jgi:hypothetical protein